MIRFNGTEFQSFPGINCRSLAEDELGVLWIGTTAGLFRCENGRCTRIDLAPTPGDYSHSILSLCPNRGGGVWALDRDGLAGIVNGKLERVPGTRALSGGDRILQDKVGGVWMLGEWPHCWNPATKKLTPAPALNSSQRPTIAVAEDTSGGLWFGGYFTELCHWQDATRKTYFGPAGGFSATDLSLCTVSDNEVWIGTAGNGLWLFNGTEIVRPSSFDGRDFGTVDVLLKDREQNIWIGTSGNGVYRLEPKKVVTITERDGLIHNDVWSISESHDGSVWVGTSGGVSHLKGTNFESYTVGLGPDFPLVRSVTEDFLGNVWAGTDHGPGGLFRLSDDRFVHVKDSEGFPSKDVSGLLPVSDGTLLIGGGEGLTRWQNGKFHNFSRYESGEAFMPFLDSAGNLWTGGEALRCLRKGRVTVYGAAEGLDAEKNAVMHEDENGALWIATVHSGLIRYKNGQFKAIREEHGFFSNLVLSLLEDQFGRYWFGCHRGIFYARKQDLNAVADGQQSSLTCVAYDTRDGMLSAEGNGGNSPDACKTRDGRLWFPTTKGIAIIDPSRTLADDKPPGVVIEEVRADGETIFNNAPEGLRREQAKLYRDTPLYNPATSIPKASGAAKLPPGKGRSLLFTFTSNTFAGAEKVRFRYRLEGRDEKWISVAGQRLIQLANLSPDSYVLRIAACNPHGVWNPDGIAFAVILTPQFHETWTFKIDCVLIILMGVAALQAFRLSSQRRILGLERAAALGQERERIARDMHDDLGTSLTRIASLAEVARKQSPRLEERGAELETISAMSGQLVDSIGEMIWATNPKYDTLATMLAYFRQHAAQLFEPYEIRCHIEFPNNPGNQSVPVEVRRQLFLVLKEALNNIVKHARATEVTITIKVDGPHLDLTIADNGQGMTLPGTKNFHHGLMNMQERVTSLGGTFELKSEPGNGTVLTARVPLLTT